MKGVVSEMVHVLAASASFNDEYGWLVLICSYGYINFERVYIKYH